MASGELPVRDAWITPKVDNFDGRAFYAAKTASDGQHRYLLGWNPTREHEQDNTPWQWGGNLVVHELVQEADGSLGVHIPQTVAASFHQPLPIKFERGLGKWTCQDDQIKLDTSGFGCASAGALPETCRIDLQLEYDPGVTGCGVMLHTSHDFEGGYYVRIEPELQRLVFDSWPRPGDLPFMPGLERPLITHTGEPVQITLYIDESLCEIYVNQRVALSTRMYAHRTGELVIFTIGEPAVFSRIQLHIP